MERLERKELRTELSELERLQLALKSAENENAFLWEIIETRGLDARKIRAEFERGNGDD
jgi:cell shape-determining protein MreC